MVYGLLADLVVLFHLIYIVFAVGGELAIVVGWALNWRWIRNLTFRLAHLASIVVVVIEASLDVMCPLTVWEYELRVRAGQEAYKDVGFIERMIHSVIFYDFPHWVFTVTYIAFGGLVILTFVLVPPEWKHRTDKPQ